jgi:hypothetical protein
MTTALAPLVQEQTYFAVVPHGESLIFPIESIKSQSNTFLLAELLDLQNPNSLASSSTSQPSSTPHRYLRLPHPRNDKPSLYLVYRPAEASPDEIVLEVQSINPDKKRSWFYGEQVVGGQSRRLVFLLCSWTWADWVVYWQTAPCS